MLSAAAARPACAASFAVPPALADPSAAAAAAAHAASGMPALAACLYAAEPAAIASASSRAAASAFCARRRAVCGTWTFSFQARGTLAGLTAAEGQKKHGRRRRHLRRPLLLQRVGASLLLGRVPPWNLPVRSSSFSGEALLAARHEIRLPLVKTPLSFQAPLGFRLLLRKYVMAAAAAAAAAAADAVPKDTSVSQGGPSNDSRRRASRRQHERHSLAAAVQQRAHGRSGTY